MKKTQNKSTLKSDSWDVEKAHESVIKKSQKSWFIYASHRLFDTSRCHEKGIISDNFDKRTILETENIRKKTCFFHSNFGSQQLIMM